MKIKIEVIGPYRAYLFVYLLVVKMKIGVIGSLPEVVW